MKENINILLDRRAEIKEQINKLEKEYKAIGDLIQELYRYKEKEKKIYTVEEMDRFEKEDMGYDR